MRSGVLALLLLQLLFMTQIDRTHSNSPASPDYVYTYRAECHYFNATQRVRFLDRHYYNQEEFVYFDSYEGRFIAKTEFGRIDADYWNKDKEFIEQKKAEVQTICVHNYDIIHSVTADRRVEPTIKISLMPNEGDSHLEHHMLVCNVHGFYPSQIDVKWYRNGEEETAQVQSTDTFQNGDWTFHILVMLETEIQKGDTFTCEVHHKSLETPRRVDWHPQTSDSSKSKMATGIVGFVLGAVFIIAGVLIYMRGQKVQTTFRGPQTEHFIRT